MSKPSPVKHSRHTTLPVPRQALHTTGVPPMARYPPSASQFGQGARFESAQNSQPNDARHCLRSGAGRMLGGAMLGVRSGGGSSAQARLVVAALICGELARAARRLAVGSASRCVFTREAHTGHPDPASIPN